MFSLDVVHALERRGLYDRLDAFMPEPTPAPQPSRPSINSSTETATNPIVSTSRGSSKLTELKTRVGTPKP